MDGRHDGLVGRLRAHEPVWRRHGRLGAVLLAAIGVANAGIVAIADATTPERGYELVSPGDKNLGAVNSVTRASADGDAVGYGMLVAGDESRSSVIYPSTLARRATDGWLRFSADAVIEGFIDGSQAVAFASRLLAVSPDQTKAILVTMTPLQPDDQDVFGQDLYLEDLETGDSQLVSTGPTDANSTNVPDLVGASSDFSHIVFRYSGALTADAGSSLNLYEWHNGSTRLVSALPNGTPATSPTPGSIAYGWTAVSAGGTFDTPMAASGTHTVSDDGSRIFFRQGANSYVRIDGTTTVPLSTSTRTSGTPAGGTLGQSVFIGADPSGSLAYFFSNQQLTDAATPGGGVYQYDIDADDLQLVTPPTPGGVNSTVQQGGGISEDGSTLYFVAKAALTADATANLFNLYEWTADDGTHLVATTTTAPTLLRISGDGRYALFTSTESLAGADTAGTYKALYRYDRQSSTLACVSCRSDGAASTADATLSFNGGTWMQNPRALAENGNVVFETTDQLVAEDTDAAADVYLFDSGRLQLISSGAGSVPSHVGDNDETADNVFFGTSAALVSHDIDGGLTDLYDARVGGGFPEPLPPPAPDCTGIDCAPAPPARPAVPGSSSSAPGGTNASPGGFSGPRVEILRVSAARKRLLARRGWVAIPVRVTGGGRLVLKGRAPLGGHLKTVAATTRHITKTESVTRSVVLRLSKKAKKQLHERGHLSLRLVARVAGLSGPETAIEKLTLKRAS